MQDYKYRAYRKEIKLSESCDRHKSIFLNNFKTCYFNFSFDIALTIKIKARNMQKILFFALRFCLFDMFALINGNTFRYLKDF